MAATNADGYERFTIDKFLKRVNMTDAEFCRQVDGLGRGNVRHWRKAKYYVLHNAETNITKIMKPVTELKRFKIKANTAVKSRNGK